VALARALAKDTHIIQMDEAVSALHPLSRSRLQDELLRLQADLHKTILFITHDFDEALKIGNRVAILNDGAVEQEGRPEEIVLRPATPHIEAFVRDVNKARAIHVRSIMHPIGTQTCEHAVPGTARCEEVLPLFAEHDWVGVTDAEGKLVGRLNARDVIMALGSHRS
jgi:glycine betaine/proline transport system ATP-binding protein